MRTKNGDPSILYRRLMETIRFQNAKSPPRTRTTLLKDLLFHRTRFHLSLLQVKKRRHIRRLSIK